jgi:hypothetical protein
MAKASVVLYENRLNQQPKPIHIREPLTRQMKELAHIDRRLNLLLGPPAPQTPEQRAAWIERLLPETPILEKWDPPARMKHTQDGGFTLSQNAICYQRGYCPQTIFDQYVDIYSDRFHSNKESSRKCIAGLAYDFLVVIKSCAVAAGCMVEFRCSVDGKQPPYLYISSLCTHKDHCGRRLAHQITHSIHTLGALMLEQNHSGNTTWRNAIPQDTGLFMGLSVRKTPGCDTDKRLVKLYTGCGMATRQMNPLVPNIDYKSFTPYSIFNWRLNSSDGLIPMWKQVRQGMLYSNEGGILTPCENGEVMYYEFPPEDLAQVEENGIVHKQHAYLHPHGGAHIADTEDIIFTKKAPAPGRGVFCIKTKEVKTETFKLKISIPAYFAASIYAHPTCV